MHQISIEQNRDHRLDLLRAQRILYGRAKLLQTVFLFFALSLPAIGIIWGTNYPLIRPYLAFASIAVLLVEVGLVSRMQRETTKRAARTQEQFDTEVLKLPWNALVVGQKVDPEDIRSVTSTPISDLERKYLENWYEPSVSTLPLPLARLICQRTNITYDMRVRVVYSAGLLTLVAVLAAALSMVGLYEGLTFADLIVTVFVPFVPLAAFALREHRKQTDTVDTLTTLKGEVYKIWNKALKAPDSIELEQNSRALQDAIYRNRATNPLVYNWVYMALRKRNEDQANHGAKIMVAEAQGSLAGNEAGNEAA